MTVHAFFATEASDCLDRLDRAAAEAGRDGGVGVERALRALAGIARLGEHARLYGAATAIVSAMRDQDGPPDDARLRETIADLRVLLAGSDDEAALNARLGAIRARWGAAEAQAGEESAAIDPEFFHWVADETAAIAECMDVAVQSFTDDPGDRDELGIILRRQRPLLGAARLGEIAIVGETLHAVEDLSEMIVRLGVPIKMEWLDVFRSARDVLRAASAQLAEGEQPDPVNALSRLRTLRAELNDRYAARVASASTAPGPADDQAVPLDTVPYTAVISDADEATADVAPESQAGETPLARALALRPIIDAGADRAAREAIAELYDILHESLS